MARLLEPLKMLHGTFCLGHGVLFYELALVMMGYSFEGAGP